MSSARHIHGFGLMEVILGVFLSTLLTTGIIQLMSASVSAYRLQLSQSQLQESGHFARDVLVANISPAGYLPSPWLSSPAFAAVTSEALDGSSARGDQLGLQRWSSQNCYGNENPIKDSHGEARFYLLQIRFRVNAARNLAITCRYGPDASQLTTQINNFGLVEGIESLQVLYAEDRNGDNIADTWVKAQAWQQESNILAIKVAMLLSTEQAFAERLHEQLTLLDESVITAADGRLRKVSTLITAIRGRIK